MNKNFFLRNKSIILKALLLSGFMFFIGQSFAEYRVYQYYVKSKFPKQQDSKAYLVTSALAPHSYIAYHGGESSVQASLVRTWICPGHTGHFKEFCKSPYEAILEKEEQEKLKQLNQ